MSPRTSTPLGAAGRGLVAGALGTAFMTAWQEVSSRLLASGADEEGEGRAGQPGSEAPRDPWEDASAPAQVARRVLGGVFHKEVSPEAIPLLTHATHWGYGTAWGALFGLIQGSRPGRPLGGGIVFGIGVWGMSYLQLVPMGLYQPPWKYPPKQLAMDLSYHLAYGAGAGAGYAALFRKG